MSFKWLNDMDAPQGEKTTRAPQGEIINVEGKSFLYDANNMALYESDLDTIISIDPAIFCSARAPYWPLQNTPRHKGYIVLQATYACNLTCQYCFVKHHYLDHTNTLDFQTAIDAVKFFQPDFMKVGVNLGYFGGEPLLNWELIVQMTEWMKTLGEEVFQKSHTHITTNGTLITEEIADYIAKHNFSLIISLDGREGDHNEARPYSAGATGNSYQDTMRGLKFCADAYKKYGVHNPITLRSTFDQHGCDLVDRLEFLNGLMWSGLAGHVSVEPSCLAESCARNTFEGINLAEIEAKFANEYMKAAKWFLAAVRAGKRPSFHHFETPLQRLYDRAPSPSECGAGKGYVSIGPAGKVCACHREHESEIGNMYSGIDLMRAAAWNDNRYSNRVGCNECWQRNLCGGGCRCNSALVYKNLFKPSEVECLFKKMQTYALFWLFSELTEAERNSYSKFNRRANVAQRGRESSTAGEALPGSMPNARPENAELCRQKGKQGAAFAAKQTGQGQKKMQAPVCGLKLCEGKNCPFPGCGKHDEDTTMRALATLRERGSENGLATEREQ